MSWWMGWWMGFSVCCFPVFFFFLDQHCLQRVALGVGGGVFWSLSFRLIPWVILYRQAVDWLGRLSLLGIEIEIDLVIPCRVYIFPEHSMA